LDSWDSERETDYSTTEKWSVDGAAASRSTAEAFGLNRRIDNGPSVQLKFGNGSHSPQQTSERLATLKT